MTPGPRKFLLTLHVVASVGWVGAVTVFLALAVVGLLSPDPQVLRASYIAMDLTYRTVLLPLGLASLTTGVVSSLATDWGLFRYYWIVVKLLVTVPAIILMLVHMQPVGYMADIVSTMAPSSADFGGLRIRLVAYAIAALMVLLIATALSTYKPRGKTRYAQTRGMEQSASTTDSGYGSAIADRPLALADRFRSLTGRRLHGAKNAHN
jgi:hypothetical protein